MNADICPLWSERWELRTKGLGCHVSTITLFTCVVSVVSTFLVVGLVVLGVGFGKWVRGKWRGRGDDWWRVWRGWRLRLVDVGRGRERGKGRDEETTPLLGENEGAG